MGCLEAGRQSEGRYKFDDVPLNQYETDDWRMSRALAAAASAPEVMAYFSVDLDDLVAHDQLLPLDDYLASDPDFDARPSGPAPWRAGSVTACNSDCRSRSHPTSRWSTAILPPSATSPCRSRHFRRSPHRPTWRPHRHFHEPDPPDGGTGTRGILGVVLSEPTSRGDYVVVPPVTAALLSALGGFRDSSGGFTPLESAQAREVLEYYRDLTHRHQLLPVGSYDLGRYLQAGTWGLGFATVVFSQAGEFGTNNRVYPFPNFGSGRSPTGAFLLSVVKSAKDPDVAYDALRHLYSVIAPESTLPPYRVDAAAIRRLMPELHGDDEHVLVHLLENAVFYDISQSEAILLGNTLVPDVLLGDTDPGDGLRRAIEELEASSVTN